MNMSWGANNTLVLTYLLALWTCVLLLDVFNTNVEAKQFQPKHYDKCIPGAEKFRRNCPKCRTIGDPFGCYGAPCSISNEALWLGSFAVKQNSGAHFLQDQTNNLAELKEMVQRLISLEIGNMKNSEIFEKMSPPLYTSYEENEWFVPSLCDPRANLFCENGMAGKRSRCECHPLYSVEVFRSSQLTPQCLGRPFTPCAFGFEGELEFFFDQGSESECEPNSKCEYLKGLELERFRNGTLWHGFGYSPIIVEYIQRQATKVCRCRIGYKPNHMHDCVKTPTP